MSLFAHDEAPISITLEQQIACVKREISMRERVYPRWILAGKLSEGKAEFELEAMKAVLASLESMS